nr:hypothetical protein DOP62_01785 [Synechococcus elongatus PCC 11801]
MPGLPVPGLPVPGLPVPGLPVPGLPVPGVLVPGESTPPTTPRTSGTTPVFGLPSRAPLTVPVTVLTTPGKRPLRPEPPVTVFSKLMS